LVLNFLDLFKYAKDEKIKINFEGRISREIKKIADKYINLSNFKNEISK